MSEKQNYALRSACAKATNPQTRRPTKLHSDNGVALNQHAGLVWARCGDVKIAAIIEMIFNVL